MDILERNKDITHISNYKTPARSRWYFEIKQESEVDILFDVILWAHGNSIPILWVSWGTNMLFAFDMFEWVVIKNSLLWWTYDRDTKMLESYSAEKIWEIAEDIEERYENNLWHRFIGLPWSIAWAVYWNAGCFGLETENNFISCKLLNLKNGTIVKMDKKDMDFEYRTSKLKKEKKYFLISATFDLSKKIEKYHSDVDNIDFRENKQPKWNSCGSFFKNPSRDQSAGYMIEQVGLKWYSIWWAYFSSQHANFLMNDGTASFEDMLELISLAQYKVQMQFWVMLENEVQIINSK